MQGTKANTHACHMFLCFKKCSYFGVFFELFFTNSFSFCLSVNTWWNSLLEALSVLMPCAPSNRRRPFSYHTKMADFHYSRVLSVFSWKKLASLQKNVLNMASSDSQIDKPQRGRPKRAELPDANINTVAQSINTERASFNLSKTETLFPWHRQRKWVSFV